MVLVVSDLRLVKLLMTKHFKEVMEQNEKKYKIKEKKRRCASHLIALK